MNVTFDHKRIFKAMLYAIFFLIGADILGVISTFVFEHPQVFGFVPMFNLNTEANVPTFFAALLHLTASLLLACIASSYQSAKDARARYWKLLSVWFIFTAFDESARIHELSMAPVRDSMNLGGLLYFSWVIPASIALLALGLFFAKFLLSLPRDLLKNMMLSACVFIGGALLVELPEGMWYELHGKDNLIYAMMTTVEESMELFGLAIFIRTLSKHLNERKFIAKVTF